MRWLPILLPTTLALALAFAAPAALAQGRVRAAPAPAPAPVTTYGEGAFDPTQIDGTQHRPDHDLVRARRLRALGSLVRVRPDFYRELAKTVESL